MNNYSLDYLYKNKTACIILNWKNTKATIACLKSVMEAELIPDYIYIVDNYSQDNAIENIVANLKIELAGNLFEELMFRAIWIQCLDNYGYAGGNNMAIKDVYNNSLCEFYWILNNDVTVSSNSLLCMLTKLESNDNYGFVGTPVLRNSSTYLHCHGGGKLLALIGITTLINKGKKYTQTNRIGPFPDYIIGCNLLLRKDIVSTTGYMNESYFMYSEEVEWQHLASKHGWLVAVAEDTLVRHWIGSENRSNYYYYYKNRADLLFVKNNYSFILLLFTILSHVIIISVNKPTIDKVKFGFRGVIDGFLGKTGILPEG